MATPVYDAPNLQKNAENQVSSYSLTLNETSETVQTFNNVDTDNPNYPFNVGTDYETKWKYYNYNSAINVYATTYQTNTRVSSAIMMQNYNYLNIVGDTSYHVTRSATVLQITGYNYNLNNNINVTLQIGIQDLSFGGNDYEIDSAWYYRSVITSTQDWSNYINRQIVSFSAEKLLYDIRDPNNNYTYREENSYITLYQEIQQDTINVELLPNGTTYVVIEYVPVVKLVETWNTQSVPVDCTTEMSSYNWIITGTNVIPTETYEVVDIPGLMWQILAMPFAFISQAFNLTLFPGTPYQVNISNLFLSIIAIFVFVWLIGLFFKMKG